MAAAVARQALVDVRAAALTVARVAAWAIAARSAAGGVRACGQRVAAAVAIQALIDI